MAPLNTFRILLFSSLVAFALLLTASSGHAADLEFVGSGSFEIQNNQSQVEISFDRLSNLTNGGRSGTIQLKLIANQSNSPTGNSIFTLAETTLGELDGGSSFINIRTTAPYTAPPSGTYFVYLVVVEFPNLNTVSDSVPATNNPFQLGISVGSGTGSSFSNAIDLGSSNRVVSGTIAQVGTQLYYEFSVTRNNEQVTIETTGSTDTVCRLFTLSRNEIISDDDGGSGTNCRLVRSLNVGTYFVSVEGFDNNVTGNFTLSVDRSGGGTTTAPPPGLIDLQCPCSYQTLTSTVRMQIDRLLNVSTTTTSGSLTVKLFATTGSTPFTTGFTLATLDISTIPSAGNGTLAPGSSFNDIVATRNYTRPPSGRYNVFMVVSQFPNTNTVLDYIQFDNALVITSTASGFPTSSGGGGGAGGGGSAPLLVLALLPAVWAGRIMQSRAASGKRLMN